MLDLFYYFFFTLACVSEALHTLLCRYTLQRIGNSNFKFFEEEFENVSAICPSMKPIIG